MRTEADSASGHHSCVDKTKTNETEFEIPALVSSFLVGIGNSIVSDLEKECKVEINVNGNRMCIKGCEKNAKKCRKSFKDKIEPLQKSIPVTLSESQLHRHKNEVNNLLKENRCVWKLKNLNGSCGVLATWSDPLSSLDVSVVKMSDEPIECEALVVLTNDRLFPLEDDKRIHGKSKSSIISLEHFMML